MVIRIIFVDSMRPSLNSHRSINSTPPHFFFFVPNIMDKHIPMLMNITYISFFFLVITITTFFPHQSHSQPQQHQPVFNYSSCRDTNINPTLNHNNNNSYNCGRITNISYPFWGQNRRSPCGAGNFFHLNCHENNTTTTMTSSQNFTVLDINTKTHTIKLKRTYLDQNLCSPQFNDTYLFPPLFQYPSTVYNITIFYNCTQSPPISPKKPICESPNHAFYIISDEFKLLEESRNCKRHIQVPIGADFPVKNDYYGYYFERDVLENGLDKGFEVKYTVKKDCLRCLGNEGGDCSSDYIEKYIQLCYYDNCPDGSIAYYCSSHHKNPVNWKRKLVIAGVGSAAMVALLMCIIICCYRGKSSVLQIKFRLKTKNDINIESFLRDHGALLQKRYKFAEIKKMTDSFKIKLGQGGYGVVYKGKLFNGCLVAVKILNASKGNGEEFINEVASITRTAHLNVVTLLGFCFEGRKKALVYEFMSNGSLDKYIYNKGPETIASLSWDNMHQIAKGIARGLDYLHRGCATRILHFDIKPHNILLDENFCPKISDFGLAKLCLKKDSIVSMSDQRGTIGYVAPEVWNRQFGGVSHKSDVYSYGMMLLEMVGGRKNINADASHTSEIYFPHWVYNRLDLGTNLRPDGVISGDSTPQLAWASAQAQLQLSFVASPTITTTLSFFCGFLG